MPASRDRKTSGVTPVGSDRSFVGSGLVFQERCISVWTRLLPLAPVLRVPGPEALVRHHLADRKKQSSMNLPPDKARLLRQYDNEKKWDLICDQERFQVKNPPHTYIQKLQTFLDPGMTRKKFRRRVQESTKVLRELEISLRTNHIGWVREFLNDENKGLDVLVEYLSFAQCAVMFDCEGLESGEDGALEKLKSWSRSIEDLQHPITLSAPFATSLARSARPSALRCSTLPSRKALKNSRLVSQKDDVHVCIMCLRAIMNYQDRGWALPWQGRASGWWVSHSARWSSPRTKALVLELLAAVCLVRGGHEIILAAFDNFKEVCKETHRFEKLMDYFRNEDSSIDFMVACMQFINIVVHSVEDMNFRVHLQYEFTKLGLEEFLQKSRHTESEKLQVQIQAYLDNVFDVGGLLEDAETKNVALEKVEELEEHLTEKLLDLENENVMRVAELEKQLLQREKELELVKLLDTKSTDRKLTLLHFIALTVREKYPDLATFWQELHFVEKAAAVSLENVLLDVKELGRGMDLIRRECSIHDNSVLRNFLGASEGRLEKLQKDARTAEDAYNMVVRYFGESPKTMPPSVFFPVFVRFIRSYKDAYNMVVRYFGESPKTMPPSVFFPVFVRFIRSYKDAEQENEQRKKQEEVLREKMLAQEAKCTSPVAEPGGIGTKPKAAPRKGGHSCGRMGGNP
ncbi:Formin-like protein 3 [Chelonia mydas]|uniref:Formin-like protein 3 n=1 Tax=Chelonia mydas TaxID=8469 RepID=M7BSW3_CHEMY|nr:Formin-like protein 3 [Chelonia mydas]